MDGSLHKKKGSKNWYMVFRTVDYTGKATQKWESTKTSNENKAKQILRKRLNELEMGINVEFKKVSFKDLLEEYQKTSRYVKLAYNTKIRYESIIKTSLTPFFGAYKVDNITPALVQKYIDALELEEGKSPYTIKQHHTVLKMIMEYARMKLRIIPYNPCKDVDLPKRSKRKPTIWTREQCEQYISYIKDKPYYMPILLQMTTGARVGEICALKLDDYNKDESTLRIANSMSRDNSIKDTKTHNVREFKLAPTVKKEIDRYILMQKKMKLVDPNYNKEGFLCMNYHFRPYRPNALKDAFQRSRKACNLPYIRMHDLRHSFITLMLESGEIDIKTVSEMVGHAKITTTQQIYQHVTENMKTDLSKSIEKTFFNLGVK